ncbi:mg2+ transporter -like zinc transport protein [Stemphylium lycopersici]|nr:mg2+ transporter -like zinc transport protein [Stemphylium lycopersici]
MEKFEAHMGGEHEHENFERGSGAVQKFAHKEQMRKSAQISDDEQAVCGHEEDYKANDLAGDGDSRDWNPQRISRARERRRTSLEDLQRCDLSRTWPRLDRFEAIARPLPPSSASSTKEPVGPDIERVDTIKSLDQLLLRPNEIALPDDTCGQEGASIQPEITRPAREPERPLGQNFGPNQRPYSPLRRKRTDQWGKAQENRRPPRSRLWDLVFAGLQPGGRLRQERKLPVAITRKKHPANSEPEFSEAEVYRSNVTKLAAQFSHLHNVNTDQTKTRHGWSSRIMFYDVLDSLQREAIRLQEPWSGAKVQPDYHEFRDVLKEVSSDCIQRVILVEDISPSLIDYLGAVFDIPPHVFEEHLDGSGYAGDLSQRSGAARWQNHFPDQGSSSVTWFRPVIPLLPITPELRDDLLQNKRPPIRCVAANCKEKHHICVQTTTNIWRRNMALCPYPGVYHKHSETDYPVGWEERMTICVREFGNSILLLDPLPFARADSRVHARRQKAMQQRLTVVKTSDPFPASQASRTRRGSTAVDHITIENWVTEQQSSLSQDHQPESQVLPPPLEPARNVGATSPPSLPSPANSASSVPLEHPKPRPSGVRFLDPKRPAKTRADWTGTNAGLAGVGFSGVETHSQPTRLGLKRASGGGQYLDSRPSSPSHRKPFAEAHGSLSRDSGSSGPPTIRNNHDRFLLYHPIKAAPSSSAKLGVAITALDIPAYIERLQVPSSTLEKFEASMRNLGKGKETAFDPLRAVFRIIHDDTNSLMDVIEDSLQRIRSDTLDEALLEQRIAFWRKLIHNLNSGLTELDQQLRAFVHFMDDLDSVYFSDSQRGELPSEQLARDTRQTLRSCLGLLERSSMALLTEIQIVDSRRSIAEAESISKLTELAFVFIPLSFVASLFSMEIRELDGALDSWNSRTE